MARVVTSSIYFGSGIRNDAYIPQPAAIDAYDTKICNLCNTIGEKLRFAGYTLSELKTLWRRSRQNSESIEIICDLTALKKHEVLYALGLSNQENSIPDEEIGISDYWIREHRALKGAVV